MHIRSLAFHTSGKQGPCRGGFAICQPGFPFDDRLRAVPVALSHRLPAAQRPDEHVCAFVLRLLHGAHSRASPGIRKQHPEHHLEHRLGGGPIYFWHRTGALRLHAVVHRYGGFVFRVNRFGLDLF